MAIATRLLAAQLDAHGQQARIGHLSVTPT